jgi:hypothetical protein
MLKNKIIRKAGLISTLLIAPFSNADTTRFIAWGDMPYNPRDIPAVKSLVSQMDVIGADFSIHVGDIKGSKSDCDTSTLTEAYDIFQQAKHPIIYTPGDNEWVDCDNRDPHEALEEIRTIYFSDPNESLGGESIRLKSQEGEPEHSTYIENARWNKGGLVFSTIHVTGFDNGKSEGESEYITRTAAAVAWIEDAFTVAKRKGHSGVVIAMQADPWTDRAKTETFQDILDTLENEAKNFAGHVMLIHGDSHRCRVNPPGDKSNPFQELTNLWRVEVFKSPIDAISIDYDSSNPAAPFAFTSVMGNDDDCSGITGVAAPITTIEDSANLAIKNINGLEGDWIYYSIDVAANTPALEVNLSGTGSAILVAKLASQPSLQDYNASDTKGVELNIVNPAPGTWFIGIKVRSDGLSNATLTAEITDGF